MSEESKVKGLAEIVKLMQNNNIIDRVRFLRDVLDVIIGDRPE